MAVRLVVGCREMWKIEAMKATPGQCETNTATANGGGDSASAIPTDAGPDRSLWMPGKPGKAERREYITREYWTR